MVVVVVVMMHVPPVGDDVMNAFFVCVREELL